MFGALALTLTWGMMSWSSNSLVTFRHTLSVTSTTYRRQHEHHPYYQVRHAQEAHLVAGAGRTLLAPVHPMDVTTTAS